MVSGATVGNTIRVGHFSYQKKTYERPPTRLLENKPYVRLQLPQVAHDDVQIFERPLITLFRSVTVQYDMLIIGEIIINAPMTRVARFVDSERLGAGVSINV